MGSLLVVTGPPGAGKSTVARVLADRTSPSALVTGDAVADLVEAERARGHLDYRRDGPEPHT